MAGLFEDYESTYTATPITNQIYVINNKLNMVKIVTLFFHDTIGYLMRIYTLKVDTSLPFLSPF